MPYVAFHELCPDVAARETRNISLALTTDPRRPSATYQFVEMYCDEPGCDCRRVMFLVFSSASQQVEAVVAWGWETLDFYRRWMGADDASIEEMRGPVLNLGSPQGPHAAAILELTKDVLLKDPAYVERLKLHYGMFREQLPQDAATHLPGRRVLQGPASPKLRASERRCRRRKSR